MQAVRLRLRVPDGSFPGVDTALSRAEGVSREQLIHFEWFTNGSYTLLYRLGGDAVAVVDEVLADHPEVLAYDVHESGGHGYCFVHVTERDFLSELLQIVDEHALVLDRPIQFVEEGVALTVAGPSSALREAFRDATDLVGVEVQWSGEYDPAVTDALPQLTSRQREAIRTAYDLGFYEKPRETSYEEIADALDCAPSTANELLRRAETTIVGAVLDG